MTSPVSVCQRSAPTVQTTKTELQSAPGKRATLPPKRAFRRKSLFHASSHALCSLPLTLVLPTHSRTVCKPFLNYWYFVLPVNIFPAHRGTETLCMGYIFSPLLTADFKLLLCLDTERPAYQTSSRTRLFFLGYIFPAVCRKACFYPSWSSPSRYYNTKLLKLTFSFISCASIPPLSPTVRFPYLAEFCSRCFFSFPKYVSPKVSHPRWYVLGNKLSFQC